MIELLWPWVFLLIPLPWLVRRYLGSADARGMRQFRFEGSL